MGKRYLVRKPLAGGIPNTARVSPTLERSGKVSSAHHQMVSVCHPKKWSEGRGLKGLELGCCRISRLD